MLKFNLPQAWIVSVEDSDIRKGEHSTIIPAISEAKVSDIVFIYDPLSRYVISEGMVKNDNGTERELIESRSLNKHPWLSIDSMKDYEIISKDFCGVERLSQTAFIQMKTVFNNPERYK